MRIEWLNEAKNRALITRGMFRKQSAIVCLKFNTWHFESTDTPCYLTDSGLSCELDRERVKDKPSPWTSTPKLPRARVI